MKVGKHVAGMLLAGELKESYDYFQLEFAQ